MMASSRIVAAILTILPALQFGCGEARRPDKLVTRPSLELSAPRPRPSGSSPVDTRFRSFSELAAGLELPKLIAATFRPDDEAHTEPRFYPENEVNNTAAEATEVSLPAILSGHIHPLPEGPSGDEDWFTFLVERDRPGVMELEAPGVPKIDLVIDLYYDSVRGRTHLFTLDNGGRGQVERLPNVNLVNGRYYLSVHPRVDKGKVPAWNVVNPYAINLTMREGVAATETEPNDDRLAAVPLPLAKSFTGLVNKAMDIDWYRIDLYGISAFSVLAVDVLPPMGTTLEIALSTQNRQDLVSMTASDGKRVLLPNLVVLDGAGAYFLRVHAPDGKVPKEGYVVTVTNTTLAERQETEPDSTPESALRLLWEEPLSGWLSHDGDVDWFYLEPSKDLSLDESAIPALNLLVSGTPGINLILEVLEADHETLLARFDDDGKGKGEEAPNLPLPERRLYIKVSSGSGYNANANYLLQARAVMTEGMEVEPNNTPEGAMELTDIPPELQGYLSPRSDRDCFRFIPQGVSVRIAAPPDSEVVVSAYDSTGRLVDQRIAQQGSDAVVGRLPDSLTVCLQLGGDAGRAPRSPYVLTLNHRQAVGAEEPKE
jgi:hypothetical protein